MADFIENGFRARNFEILERRLSGETLRQIGEAFDISTGRVRQILQSQLYKIQNYERRINRYRQRIIQLQNGPTAASEHPGNALRLVSSLEVSVRVENALRYTGHWGRPVAEIQHLPDSYWLRVPNFGRKSLNELRKHIGPVKAAEDDG